MSKLINDLLAFWLEGDYTVGPVLCDALEEAGWPWLWSDIRIVTVTPQHFPLHRLLLGDCWLASVYQYTYQNEKRLWSTCLTSNFVNPLPFPYQLDVVQRRRNAFTSLAEAYLVAEADVKHTLKTHYLALAKSNV